MKEIRLAATVENIGVATDFVDAQLEKTGCPMKIVMKINVAIDEVFGNIANYAYKNKAGDVILQVELEESPGTVIITFIDEGIPYDPTAVATPDTTLSADERAVGGLGIFLVKKLMDSIDYRYENGKNILSIMKHI